MPGIENANGLTLSNIAEHFQAVDERDTQEFLSEGTNLYVKNKPLALTDKPHRIERRNKAITLLCQGLATEHNMTDDQARKILNNVFGQAPARITVSDVLKLQALGETAARIHKNFNRDFSRSFELARAIKEFPNDAPFKEMAALVRTFSPADVTEDQRYEEKAISNFRPFESSSPREKKYWFDFAMMYGTSTDNSSLRRLPPEQKLSLQMAVTEHLHALPKGDDASIKRRNAAMANAQICAGYTLCDLISPEDMKMLKAFMEEASKNKIVCNGYAKWGSMDIDQRREVVQTLIDLHAASFGYTKDKPTLEFIGHSGHCEEDPILFAVFHSNDNKLSIITSHESFNNVGHLFNRVINALTHKYQTELVARMKRNDIEPNDPQHTRARIFDFNNKGDHYSSSADCANKLGVNRVKALIAHSSNPTEQMASHMGNYAESVLPAIFAPPEKNETAEATVKDDGHGLATVDSTEKKGTRTFVSTELSYKQYYIENLISKLPPFESRTPDQKEIWLDTAMTLGKSEKEHGWLRHLSPERKLSLQMAITEYLDALPPGDFRQRDVILANAMFCAGYTLDDLIAPEDIKMLNAFLEELPQNKIVCDGYVMWGKMTVDQRREVVQTLIDLHAEKFGYTEDKPTLEFRERESQGMPNVIGQFGPASNTLVIIFGHTEFINFAKVCGTVAHESAHKCQYASVKRMQERKGAPNDPQDTRARIFELNNGNSGHYFPSSEFERICGVPSDQAHSLYKSNPLEQAAFHFGDYVESKLPEIFASLDNKETAEKGE